MLNSLTLICWSVIRMQRKGNNLSQHSTQFYALTLSISTYSIITYRQCTMVHKATENPTIGYRILTPMALFEH